MTKNNKKIKTIAWITFSPMPLYVQITEELVKRHADVQVKMVFKKGRGYRIKSKYIKTEEVVVRHPIRRTGLEYFSGFNELMDRIKPDVIATNLYYGMYSYQAYRYAQKNNIKFILNTEEKDYKSLARKIFFPI